MKDYLSISKNEFEKHIGENTYGIEYVKADNDKLPYYEVIDWDTLRVLQTNDTKRLEQMLEQLENRAKIVRDNLQATADSNKTMKNKEIDLKKLSQVVAEKTRKLEEMAEQNDTVNHPSHYTDGKIEVIDFIEDKGLNFHRGNAVKYIARAGKKDKSKEVEDLQKAVWYLQREIDRLKGNEVK